MVARQGPQLPGNAKAIGVNQVDIADGGVYSALTSLAQGLGRG